MAIREYRGHWQVDVYNSEGKRVRMEVKGNKDDAILYERELKKRFGKTTVYAQNTVGDLIPQYLQFVKLHQSASSCRNKERDLENRIEPFFGKMYPEQITNLTVDLYKMKRVKESGEGKNHRQINVEIMALSALVNWAYEHKIVENPFPKVKKLKYIRPLPDVLGRGELKKFMLAAEPFYRCMFLCMYHAGMRIDEVKKLRHDNISFGRNVLTITGKGNKTRTISMSSMLRNALGKMVKTGEYVFVSRRTGNPCVDVRKAIARAKEKAGITKHIHPHMFRSCFATHLLEGGTDVLTLKELMGHQELSTTTTYLRVSNLHKDLAIKNVFDAPAADKKSAVRTKKKKVA